MNKPDHSPSSDYSFFISIAGIGILFSCAALLVGFGSGFSVYGYFVSSIILFLTAIILIFLAKKIQSEQALFNGYLDNQNSRSGGVAMIMTSLDGDVVYVNKLAKVLYKKHNFGDPKSPLKLNISNKKSIEDILDSLKLGELKFSIVEIGDTGKFLKFEIEKIHKNGDYFSWRIFEDNIVGNSISDEGINNYLNLGQLLDRTDIGLFAVNENEKITYANKKFVKFIFEDKDAPDFPFALSLVSNHTQKNLKNRVDFITKKGAIKEAHIKQLQNENIEDLTYYIAICDENIQKKSNANYLENNNVSDNGFFRTSPIGIAVVNKAGEIAEKNIVFSNFIASLGVEVNDNLKNMLSEESGAAVFKEIKNTLNTKKSSGMIELSFLGESNKQGQFYITHSGEGITNNKNVIIYLIDITEQKSLELQFSQSQKMQAVGQLAGGVAHDFNNLLTAITGFCDLLLVKHGPGDQSFSDIIQIKQNANRAANLVRQLLAFSRQQTLRPKILIITDVVAELSNLLRRLIGSNIDLEMNHGRNIEPVRVDQGQLEQVIINLCVNARDAMPEGGKLEIKTRNINEEEAVKIGKKYPIFPKGEYVLLEVNDNGVGIEKENLQKVFEPFFSTKEIGKGTGLGLSTVYGIIKQTDGFVFPESEVGVGTSFKIFLPKYEQGEVDEVESISNIIKPEEQVRDLTGSSTILLVEDEDAVRMFAARALKNKGYTVFEADSGVSALKLYEETETRFDLLISDVMMPQMDGPSLVKKIRETDKNLKVIFISGYAEDALDDNIMEKDFNFLSKPFSLKQLAEQVKEVLEK